MKFNEHENALEIPRIFIATELCKEMIACGNCEPIEEIVKENAMRKLQAIRRARFWEKAKKSSPTVRKYVQVIYHRKKKTGKIQSEFFKSRNSLFDCA